MSSNEAFLESTPSFLAGGGIMGSLMRSKDWSTTPFGPTSHWPQSLRSMVAACLNSPLLGTVLWGPELRMLYNDAYIQSMADHHPAALGSPVSEVWGAAWDAIAPKFRSVLETGEGMLDDNVPLTLRRNGRSETTFWNFTATPIRGEDGSIVGLLNQGTETTRQVLAMRLREARLRLADTLTRALEPPQIIEAAAAMLGRHLYAARVGFGEVQDGESIAFEAGFGDGLPPLIGTFPLPVWKELHTDCFISVPLIRDGRHCASLYVAHRHPHHWQPEETLLVQEVALRTWDALSRARAEAALRVANETLETSVLERTRERDRIWELSEDFMVIASYDGQILRANPTWTRLTGKSESELQTEHYSGITHPDDVPLSLELLQSMRDAGEPVRFENRLRARDGSWLWVSWTLHPEAGSARFTGMGRNITLEKTRAAELEIIEAAYRQSQKMEAVGQLTGGLAHDFNNLLTGITGSLEMLQTRAAQGRFSEIDRYVAAAQGAARRAAALTHRLLAFSRRQTLDPKPTDINRLIADMEELIRRTVGPAIKVEVVGSAALWNTRVDQNQLENALLNLCINARDSMPGGGSLMIETDNSWLDQRTALDRELAQGQYVTLSVSDTGTGMPPEIIARAFDPFFTTKPIGMGTGLGLSMIYGFAQQSGGQARIYSQVGKGTMVRLYLPRHSGDAESAPSEAQPGDAVQAKSGETVLVVDDEPTVRMLVVDVLEELGYTPLEAGDGPGGLATIQSPVHIDLLVTDVGLPGGINGRQLADAARVLRPELKILFITGYAENAVLNHGHLDRGMHVLTKPFTMDVLAARIKDLLKSD